MSGTDARNDPGVIDMLAEQQPDSFEALARACGMDKETFLRKWNEGCRWADKRWADNPHERGVGGAQNGEYDMDTYGDSTRQAAK